MGKVLTEEPEYMYVAGLNSIRTHNEYLQQMSETGIIGIVLIMTFIVAMLFYTVGVVKSSSSVEKVTKYLFLEAGLLIIFVHSVLSFPGHLMPNALLTVFLFGFIMSPEFFRSEGSHCSYVKGTSATAGCIRAEYISSDE
jgi:O-antigen ligase